MLSSSRDPRHRKSRYRFGLYAEWFCRMFLRLKGYRILASRCRTPVGEIDIVARHGNTLVLVEVKARQSWQSGVEALGAHQRLRLRHAAQWFMNGRPDLADSVRFDVMVVVPRAWPRHILDAWRDE